MIEETYGLQECDARSLLALAQDAIFLADARGRFLYVNAAASEMTGFGRTELLAMSFLDLVRPEDEERLQRGADAMVGGAANRSEWQLVRKDASRIFVEVAATVLPDGRWQGVVRDITERKAQEAEREALVEQAHRDRTWLSAVIERMPVAVVLFQHGGRVSFNTQAERLLGLSLAGGVGAVQYASRMFYPDGRSVPFEAFPFTAALRGREAVGPTEYVIRGEDGSEVPILASAAPLFDPDGRIAGAVGVFQDISDSVRLQRAVRENERLLEAVFDLMPTGVRIADATGRIVRTNRAGRDLWRGSKGGREEGELRAWWVDSGERIRHDDWPARRAVRGQTTSDVLVRMQCFDGSFRTVMKYAAPLRDEQGHITGAVVVDEDVTMLHQTQEQLRAAVRDREHILAVVAHDMRSPLSAVGLHAAALEHKLESLPGAERAHAAASSIGEVVRGMSGLVNDLLAISVQESGHSMLGFVATRPDAIVRRVADAVGPMYAAAGLRLFVDADAELPTVQVDPNRIQRVFANLLDNALKFTESGGLVALRAESTAGGVLFSVANSGPALRADEMKRIFQPFWQAGREDRRGAGLGLSICRSIVEAHGGSVWTEAAHGMRVKIQVLLPCVAAFRAAPARATAEGQ